MERRIAQVEFGETVEQRAVWNYLSPMTRRLFREEVFEARRLQSFGSGRLSLGPSRWVIVGVAALLAAALLAFGFFSEVARKSHVQGLLLPSGGSIALTAPSAGRVLAVHAAEGQVVEAGTALFALAMDRDTAAGAVGEQLGSRLMARREALQSEQRLRATQIRMQQEALQERIRAIEAEERRLDYEIELSEGRQALVQQQADRLAQLVTAGFVSAMQEQAHRQELLEATAAIQRLHRNRIALERDRIGVAREGARLGTELMANQFQVERQIAGLDQERIENDARQAQIVFAPTAVTVTLVAASSGQQVQPGQLVASIIPARSSLQAHLFAPSRTIGFAEVGQSVRLRYAAYPYQKFGLQEGRIASVSRSPAMPSELSGALAPLAQAVGGGMGVYRVTVDLDRQHIDVTGSAVALKVGMAVDAVLIHEKRRVIEWAFEPLVAALRRHD